MTMWGNICRICSSPADYNIFAKIPAYLHGSTNEFLNYQKPINLLLEETTGLKNSPDDGLPLYVCALCISYLKHAVTFREQCIKNAISLKLLELCQQKATHNKEQEAEKESILFTADQLHFVERQQPVNNLLQNNNHNNIIKVHKKLLNQDAPQQKGNKGNNRENGNEQRINYLNALFDKQRNATQTEVKMEMPSTSAGSGSGNGTPDEDYPTLTSSDDNEENTLSRKHKNCYNYSETNFEEDDPMEQAQLRDIKVKIPRPSWKERKCSACLKRFMHEATHKFHIDNCVEYQFVGFVAEVTKLLEIKRQKMVSPHEFIRRMIFALFKICTWLQEHSIDTELADKLKQIKLTNGNNAEKAAAAIAAAPQPAAATTGIVNKPKQSVNQSSSDLWGGDSLSSTTKTNNTFNNVLFNFKDGRGSTTPITVENNVLYAIERSESRNSQQNAATSLVVKKPIPIRGTATAAPPTLLHEERATFLQKLQRAVVTPQQQSPIPLLPLSAARCNQCNLMFDSVSELEIHNVMYHNGQCNAKEEDAQRRRIIALFEDDI